MKIYVSPHPKMQTGHCFDVSRACRLDFTLNARFRNSNDRFLRLLIEKEDCQSTTN